MINFDECYWNRISGETDFERRVWLVHIMHSTDSFGRLMLTKREENCDCSGIDITEGLHRKMSKSHRNLMYMHIYTYICI